jgi:hypothetical protein
VNDVIKIIKVEPYSGLVNQEFFSKFSRILHVWSKPKSAVEGSKVMDEIKKPIEVIVLELQKDGYFRPQRAKIRYDKGREGWVLYDALIRK